MTESTRSISLVLIGSALFLAGCSRNPRDEDEQNQQGGSGGYRSGVFIGGGTRLGGGFSSGGSSTVGGSARGGFGGTGSGISAAG